MNDVTQEMIDDALDKCMWLSQNRDKSMLRDVCCAEMGACSRVIDSGKCPTLRKLFRQDEALFKEVK